VPRSLDQLRRRDEQFGLPGLASSQCHKLSDRIALTSILFKLPSDFFDGLLGFSLQRRTLSTFRDCRAEYTLLRVRGVGRELRAVAADIMRRNLVDSANPLSRVRQVYRKSLGVPGRSTDCRARFQRSALDAGRSDGTIQLILGQSTGSYEVAVYVVARSPIPEGCPLLSRALP